MHDAHTMVAVAQTSSIRLRLLGGFELSLGGAPVPLRPASQRLVAFVAVRSHGVERTCAAYQLWPDTSEERARANLRSTLWRLARVVPDVVISTPTRLALGHSVWVDARHGLSELISGSSDAMIANHLPFEWMSSDLLPDWYDDWLMVERERLRQLHLRALEERAREALRVGRTGEAIQLALTAVSIDPLRESSHRTVIEAHLAEGNAFEAQRQLDALNSARAHADAEVSPELRELRLNDAPPHPRREVEGRVVRNSRQEGQPAR
jgi:DNA-binding SARP family transcriptional activator